MTRTGLHLLSLLVLLAGGCGHTTIRESHIYQVQDENGRISYYRMSIDADAVLAKTNFRAGLYDAAAIDSLTGGPGTQQTDELHQILHQQRKLALEKVAKRYFELMAKDNLTPTEKLELSDLGRRTYFLANTPADSLGTQGDSGLQPAKKLVIVYSVLASVVEEAIAGVVTDRETNRVAMAALSGPKSKEYAELAGRLARVEGLLAELLDAKASLAALADDLNNTGADDTATNKRNAAILKLEALLGAISAMRLGGLDG